MSAKRYARLVKEGLSSAEAMAVLKREQGAGPRGSAAALMARMLGPSGEERGARKMGESVPAPAEPAPAEPVLPSKGLPSIGHDVHVLCFSKNRPFQLQEFLRSFTRYVNYGSSAVGQIRISVLFCCGDQYSASYAAVGRMFPRVTMLPETSFATQLCAFVKNAASENNTVLFAVDDVFFFERFDLSEATSLFRSHPSVFAFHLKLHPHVTYCHPADKPATAPTFRAVRSDPASLGAIGEGVLMFNRRDGTTDWNYPWDLCCSMYRAKDAVLIIDAIEAKFGRDGISHPNKLEANGALIARSNENVRKRLRDAPRCGCPRSPVMAVVTVNRVQTVYENRVYSLHLPFTKATKSTGGEDVLAVKTEETIETLFCEDRTIAFDDAHYRHADFKSVHVGDFVLAPKGSTGMKRNGPVGGDKGALPFVSVVMPVHNGVQFLEEAMESIFAQTYLGPWELIIVDDGSTDGSMALARAVVAKLGRTGVRLVEIVDDGGTSSTSSIGDLNSTRSVVILQLGENLGVSEALDAGIALARGKYIARMDADDVCLRTRFQRQVDYLERNTDVAVLGCAVEKFRDQGESVLGGGGGGVTDNLVISSPRSPREVEWGMWFYCALAHPTVMIRREVVFDQEAGRGERYANNALDELTGVSSAADADTDTLQEKKKKKKKKRKTVAEDYALWLRLIAPKEASPLRLANLGHVLLRLRKHSANVSRLNQEEQRDEGMRAVAEALSRRLGVQVSARMVQCLQRPEKACTASEMQAAARLLLALEKSYAVVGGIEGTGEEKTGKEVSVGKGDIDSFIVQDTTARLREMSMLGLQRFAGDAMSLLQLVQSREGGGPKGLMTAFGF